MLNTIVKGKEGFSSEMKKFSVEKRPKELNVVELLFAIDRSFQTLGAALETALSDR